MSFSTASPLLFIRCRILLARCAVSLSFSSRGRSARRRRSLLRLVTSAAAREAATMGVGELGDELWISSFASWTAVHAEARHRQRLGRPGLLGVLPRFQSILSGVSLQRTLTGNSTSQLIQSSGLCTRKPQSNLVDGVLSGLQRPLTSSLLLFSVPFFSVEACSGVSAPVPCWDNTFIL